MVIRDNAYMDSFGALPLKEILKFMKNDDVKVNVSQIQNIKSIMCRYYCILFIEMLSKEKSLIVDLQNVFLSHAFKKNVKIELKEIKKNYML